jgi:hypothetical protein
MYETAEEYVMWGLVIFTLVLMAYLVFLQYKRMKARRRHYRHEARRARERAAAAGQVPPASPTRHGSSTRRP